jgi:hypothetical protein
MAGSSTDVVIVLQMSVLESEETSFVLRWVYHGALSS